MQQMAIDLRQSYEANPDQDLKLFVASLEPSLAELLIWAEQVAAMHGDE